MFTVKMFHPHNGRKFSEQTFGTIGGALRFIETMRWFDARCTLARLS